MAATQTVKKRHADAGGGVLQQKRRKKVDDKQADLQPHELKDFQKPGDALKILTKPVKGKAEPAEPDPLAEAMEIWAEEAELGDYIQRHGEGGGEKGTRPKMVKKKEAMKAEEAVEQVQVEPEEEIGDNGEESREEEDQEDDQEVEADEMDHGWNRHDDTAPWRRDGKGKWGGGGGWQHGGWQHRGWGWQQRNKPHWAQHGWRQNKGQGKGHRDEWGGEYVEGGYRDVAGNFYPYGSGRTRKRTPGKGWQARQKEQEQGGKSKGKDKTGGDGG
ncbi:unnamed protein product [Durusdinium trenchii]|uniref:Uncharacterized protein n=1 Tax=Durusdinium trenchii TaxID=1381693 RepID=A0ABP0IB47_9DINO